MNNPNELFTAQNTKRSMYATAESVTEGNVGQVGIIKPEFLSKKYRTREYQLFHITGGFGAYPEKMGNACFGFFCATGEETRIEKYEFIGIADDETTKLAAELESKWEK